MSELNIKIRKLQDNGSTFRATPESLYMGGVGSAKVDTLCFDVPEEWKGCAITLHVQRLSGTLPDPQLLDEKNRVVVDQRWTKEKQGLWMLMAVGADGYTAMTKPGQYTCYETIDRDSTTETITPSVYEQFVALVKKETAEANRAAKNAAASAEIAKSIESTITATGEQVQREITATADQTKQAIDEKAKAALASIPEDYTALSESVGQVKEDLSAKDAFGLKLKNYLDLKAFIYKNTDINPNTGESYFYAGWTASDFMPIQPTEKLHFLVWSGTQWSASYNADVAFYDAQKNFLYGMILDPGVNQTNEFSARNDVFFYRFAMSSVSDGPMSKSPMIVKNSDFQNLNIDMTADADTRRIPYGNSIPTVYDKKGEEYVLVRNPYYEIEGEKTYFRFDTIVLYIRETLRSIEYKFGNLKDSFPNNWQGYNNAKVKECMFLHAGEFLVYDIEEEKLLFTERKYYFINIEKYILLLAYDYADSSAYGIIASQYHNKNDYYLERQRFETLSSGTTEKLYNQVNPLFNIINDENFCFAWLSDNHLSGYVGREETDMTDLAIGEIDKTLKFDAILNTGDSIMERQGVSGLNSLRKIASRFNPQKLVFCEGNHDRNPILPHITKKEFYNIVYRQTKSENIVWGSKENAYYYRDFPTHKIRIIVLNVYENMYHDDLYDESMCGYSGDQLKWLAQTALKVSPDYSIIVLTHDAPVKLEYNAYEIQNNPDSLAQILKSFKIGQATEVKYTDTLHNGVFSVDVETTYSVPGNIIAVLSGHAHCDDLKTVDGINYIQITCAYIDVVNTFTGYENRPAFSEQAYAFDIGVVDTENRTLKLKRIGYGTDRAVSY